MNVIERSVEELEKRIEGTGIEDGAVFLRVDPDCDLCPYESGACMVATFGGKSADFVTFDPTRAATKMSFMFGVKLENPVMRAAACAIINAVTAFLCISRVARACTRDNYAPCLADLKKRVRGRKITIIGKSRVLESELKMSAVDDPASADLFVVTGEGLTSDEGIRLIELYVREKEMLFIGPSPAGVAALADVVIWCPFGRS